MHYVGDELELFSIAVNWKARLRRELAPHIRGHVLEVGAGIGSTTRALRGPSATAWTCLEPDPRMCATLRSAEWGAGPSVDVLQGTVAALASESRFDTILYIDVLEHIADDRAETERVAAHVRPGGRLVVVAPAHQWLYSPFDAAVGHFRRYDRKSLRSVVPAWLIERSCRYIDSVGLLASFANRAILRGRQPNKAQLLLWDRLFVRASRVADTALAGRVGKTIVGVWEVPE